MVAPRAHVFRPLVKGNEALGTRLGYMPFAATSSRDVIFIKLWATTLRMPEMEKAYRKYYNDQV